MRRRATADTETILRRSGPFFLLSGIRSLCVIIMILSHFRYADNDQVDSTFSSSLNIADSRRPLWKSHHNFFRCTSLPALVLDGIIIAIPLGLVGMGNCVPPERFGQFMLLWMGWLRGGMATLCRLQALAVFSAFPSLVCVIGFGLVVCTGIEFGASLPRIWGVWGWGSDGSG